MSDLFRAVFKHDNVRIVAAKILQLWKPYFDSREFTYIALYKYLSSRILSRLSCSLNQNTIVPNFVQKLVQILASLEKEKESLSSLKGSTCKRVHARLLSTKAETEAGPEIRKHAADLNAPSRRLIGSRVT